MIGHNYGNNLLSDGVKTYTYHSTNRLKSITEDGSTTTFGYNGLGDRLAQNSVNYILDLNAGLTQVLNDGTNTYLYGVDYIAQLNSNTEYWEMRLSLTQAKFLDGIAGQLALMFALSFYSPASFSTLSSKSSP